MTDNGSDTKCVKCNLNFTSAKTLKIHQLQKHSSSIVKCFKCNLKFANSERFRVHWNSKHVMNKTSTEPKTANNEAAIISDDESERSDSEKSETSKKNPITVKKHQNIKINSNRCSACYKAFSSRQFAMLHYKRVHMDWTTECEICQKQIKKNLYFSHLKIHRARGEITAERIIEIQKESHKQSKKKPKVVPVEPKVPTKCPDCDKVFEKDRWMKMHWTKTHYVRPTKAKETGKSDDKTKAKIAVPTECRECHKILNSDTSMRIHYFQAHVKQRIRKTELNKELPSYPSVKSVSDLRSKTVDIKFDSNTCPTCKKVFKTNMRAKVHFKMVHLRQKEIKCHLCFNIYSTLFTLRSHFSKAHPKAEPPKLAGNRPRGFNKKKNTNEEEKQTENNEEKENKNENDTSVITITDGDSAQKQLGNNTKEVAVKKSNTQQDNPLLKMFQKMREKNAQSPVVPAKVSSEVIEIDDQSEENAGCFTLDFEKCSICIKKFSSNEAAMMHYMNKHSEEMQMCPECNKLISSGRSMLYHYKRHHPTITVPLFLRSSRNIDYSKKLFIQFISNKCSICKLEFETKSEAQAHFKDDHEVKFEICSECLEEFRSESTLFTHWTQRHDGLKFVEFKEHAPMEVDEIDETPTNDEEASSKNEEASSKDEEVPDIQSSQKTATTIENSSLPKKGIARTGKPRPRTKIYPFITSDTCPICHSTHPTRESVVTHYKQVHAKNGVQCKNCKFLFANVDHMEEHFMAIHKKVQFDVSNKNKKAEQEKQEKIRQNQENIEKTPQLQAIVSLVNMKDNIDAWSPEIKKQLLGLSKDTDNANDDKISDSGRGSTAETDDEMEYSQNEPLDLSIQHRNESPVDEKTATLMKFETVNIKYESPFDMVTSFDQTSTIGRNSKSALGRSEDIVIKDEIVVEKIAFQE